MRGIIWILYLVIVIASILPVRAYAHKVYILMSYRECDTCGGPQYRGVIDALKLGGLQRLEIKSYFLRSKTLPKHLFEKRTKEAISIYRSFRPDVTVAIDDPAFQLMAPFFLKKKGKGDLVFTGTNISPEDYNKRFHFHKERWPTARITGVYEKLFVLEQLRFIHLIFGKNLGKIPVLYSSDPIGKTVFRQIINEVKGTQYEHKIIPMEVSTLDEVKKEAREIQSDHETKTYFPVTIAVFKKNGDPTRIPLQEISPILLNTIKKPDLTVNSTYVNLGFWGGVTVDFYQMGYDAGQMALLLLKGADIHSLKIKDADKSIITINLKRNRELGLNLPPSILGLVDNFVK